MTSHIHLVYYISSLMCLFHTCNSCITRNQQITRGITPVFAPNLAYLVLSESDFRGGGRSDLIVNLFEKKISRSSFPIISHRKWFRNTVTSYISWGPPGLSRSLRKFRSNIHLSFWVVKKNFSIFFQILSIFPKMRKRFFFFFFRVFRCFTYYVWPLTYIWYIVFHR